MRKLRDTAHLASPVIATRDAMLLDDKLPPGGHAPVGGDEQDDYVEPLFPDDDSLVERFSSRSTY